MWDLVEAISGKHQTRENVSGYKMMGEAMVYQPEYQSLEGLQKRKTVTIKVDI